MLSFARHTYISWCGRHRAKDWPAATPAHAVWEANCAVGHHCCPVDVSRELLYCWLEVFALLVSVSLSLSSLEIAANCYLADDIIVSIGPTSRNVARTGEKRANERQQNSSRRA